MVRFSYDMTHYFIRMHCRKQLSRIFHQQLGGERSATSRDDGTMTGGSGEEWRNTTPCHGSEGIVVGGLSNRT